MVTFTVNTHRAQQGDTQRLVGSQLDHAACADGRGSLFPVDLPEGQKAKALQDSHRQQPPGSSLGAVSRSGKGLLLLPREGPVVGLQDCPVMVPDVLPSLRKAWTAAAATALACSSGPSIRPLQSRFYHA